MSLWSQKRRAVYGGAVILFLIIVVAIPAWLIFYKPPTCFDSKQNGDETGVDCGGSCVRLCPNAFLAPKSTWSRFEMTAPGIYNIATYIINPNPDVSADLVPYHAEIYDGRGVLITEYDDFVSLPVRRNTLAFRAGVNVGSRIPAKVTFEFTGVPNWRKDKDMVSKIAVLDKTYNEDNDASSLIVRLNNTNVLPIGRLNVYAMLYDASGNAIGFSKTILDGIPAGGTADAPFTWPYARKGQVISIEVLVVAE